MATDSKLNNKIKEFYKDWSDDRKELEDIWSMSYDAFRGDYSSGNLEKWKQLEGTTWRSKVFVRLTKMKIVSAVAQIEDVYFQGGKIPYAISPTPVPEDMGGILLDPKEAEARAKRMSQKIDDILTECKAQRKEMAAILEMAIYGMSVIEAPIIREKTRMRYQMQVPKLAGMADMFLGTQLSQKYARHIMVPETIKLPSVDHPRLWDIFWDMEGEDFQSNQGIIKRVWMSAGMLRTYMDWPGFDKAAIERAIGKGKDRLGSSESNEGPGREKLQNKRRNICVLNFCGRMPVSELENTSLWDEKEKEGKERELVCVIAEDEIIYQPKKNPWPGDLRPYHPAFWEMLPHESQGVGIAENLKDSQMMVNASVRTFIDNKALSGNVLMAGNPRMLAPGQNRTVYPGKFFELAEHCVDARQALQFFSPPDIGSGMLEMINLLERFADEESNLPKLLEGEKSVGDPKTAFAFGKLVENANKALGKVIRNVDGGHTEPMISAFYHWLMATDPDESMKGDYTCKATGFGVYQDRIVQGENLQMFLTFMLSNEVLSGWPKIDKFLKEIAKTRNIDPDEFLKSAEEKMQEDTLKLQMMVAQAGLAPPGNGGTGEQVPAPQAEV